MTLEVKDTIRLDTALAGDMPVKQYDVWIQGLADINYVPIVSRRTITGFLAVHRTMSAGVPLLLKDYHYQVVLTQEDYYQLLADVGKIMYFMEHYRDEATPLTYRKVVAFQSMSDAKPYNPELTYWTTLLSLVDATGNQVDP